MRTGQWIISHRCSRMAIYVFCCNARISFHSIYSKGLVHETLFVNYTSVICLRNMLYLYEETPLVNCGPRSYFFLRLNQPQLKLCLFFCNLLSTNNSSSTQYS